MSSALPSPRELLTSLITNLSAIPNPISVPADEVHEGHGGTAPAPAISKSNPIANNPLKLIPQSHRPLLTTLHVLYPSTVLPALDLLDRKLVTRVVLGPGLNGRQEHNHTISQGGGEGEEEEEEEGAHSDSMHENANNTNIYDNQLNPQLQHESPETDKTTAPNSTTLSPSSKPTRQAPSTTKKRKALYHLVRSAQQSKRRGGGGGGGGAGQGQVYIVRLESWNCTCAAFAFSTFPPLSSSSSSSFSISPASSSTCPPPSPSTTQPRSTDTITDITTQEEKKNVDTWQFGGLSTDGTHSNAHPLNQNDEVMQGEGGGGGGSGGVPCCKHLLACVLAERWDAVLGGYMEERIVSREEAAGLVSDI
ncbi:hypothetical protein F5Y17DRAFT_356890 [Xylariaceae sp. FL0594]|nr:hypothetical protein F5Y17DRAFT_356890 [Xylariaceae sp. FL0594]